MRFSSVIGQDEVKKRLKLLVREDRLPHALLFCGPQGSGKMALALSLASYLLCPNSNDEDSCSECNQCSMLSKFVHPDLHFSFPVIKPAGTPSDHKMISDDFIYEWREMLSLSPYFTMDSWLKRMKAQNQQAIIYVAESTEIIKKLSLKSSQGGYKVCIMWLPERMNDECANKLLKIIEEPPLKTVFLLVSENPEDIIETIRSRCQKIDIPSISQDAIEKALIETRGIDQESSKRISRIACGSWTSCLEELSLDSERALFFNIFKELMRLSYQRKVKDLKKWADNVSLFGREKQKRMLTFFLRLIRENFFFNFKDPKLIYMSSEEQTFARNFSPFVNENNIYELSNLMSRSIRDISRNANAKIVFFDLAISVIVAIKKPKK